MKKKSNRIELTLGDIYKICQNNILNIFMDNPDISVSVHYKFAKFAKKTEEEHAFVLTEQKRIVKKNTIEEEVPGKKGETIKKIDPKADEEWTEFLKEKVSMDFERIPVDSLVDSEGKAITGLGKVMRFLEPLFVENDKT